MVLETASTLFGLSLKSVRPIVLPLITARYLWTPPLDGRKLGLTPLILPSSVIRIRASKDLIELSTLGHFLKGSSAAVGVIKVRDSCECMQHYGKSRDEDGVSELTEEEALNKLTSTLSEVKVQYKEAEKALRKYYAGDGDDEEGEDDEEGDEEAAKME